MLINRIQRSMEMTLEGVDTLNVSLMLEASGEFKKGVDELEKNLVGFIKVCKPFAALANFTANLEKSLASLKSTPMDGISDTYSFANHFEILNPESGAGDTPPETTISNIALEYPTYVSALRDGILEIAKWLEQYPDVFSVGKNGIVFSKAFRGVVANQELKIKDFAQSGDEIIVLMSGVDDTSAEKTDLKSHYESIWKKEGLEPEKEDESWNKFVAGIDTIGQGASTAHDSATNAIKGIKPPDEVQQSTKKGGGILQSLIGALFGGKADASAVEPISQDPTLIVGESLTDEKGIFAMSFQDLQKLIASVIEFSGSSAAAGANALAGIDSHQKEAMKPSPAQVATLEKVQDVSKKLDTEDVTEIGAAMEKAGMKDGNTSTIDGAKLKSLLMKMYDNDEERVNVTMTSLELGDAAGGEEAGEEGFNPVQMSRAIVKTGLGTAETSNLNSLARDLITKALAELELVILSEAYEAGKNIDDIVADVIAKIGEWKLKGKEKNAYEKIKKELQSDRPGRTVLIDFIKNKLEYKLSEAKMHRWSKLAGIING